MPVVDGASETNHGMWAMGIACAGVGTLVGLQLFNPKLYDVLKWPIGIVTVGGTSYNIVRLAQSHMGGGERVVPDGPPPGPTDPLEEIWAQNPTAFANSLSEEEILEKARLFASSHDLRAKPFLEALAKKTTLPHKLADISPDTWQYVEETERKACAGLVSTSSALRKVANDLPADPDELARCIEQVVRETQPERSYYIELLNNRREALVRALPAIKQHHPEAIAILKGPLLHTVEFLPYILRADEQWGLDAAMDLSSSQLGNLAVETANELHEKGSDALKEHLAEAFGFWMRYPELVDTNLVLALAAANKAPSLGVIRWKQGIAPAIKLYTAGDARLRRKLAMSLAKRVDELVQHNAIEFAVAAAKHRDAECSLETAVRLWEENDPGLNSKLADRFKDRVAELLKQQAVPFAVNAANSGDVSNLSIDAAAELYQVGWGDFNEKLADAFNTKIEKLVEAGAIPFAVAAARKASDQVLANLREESIERLGNADKDLQARLQQPELILRTFHLDRIGMIAVDAKPSDKTALVIKERAKAEDGDEYLEAVWNRVPHFVINCLDMVSEEQRAPFVVKALQTRRSDKEWAKYLGTTCNLYHSSIHDILMILDIPVSKELLEAWPDDALIKNLKPLFLKPEERGCYVADLIRRKVRAQQAFISAAENEWKAALIIQLARQCNASDFAEPPDRRARRRGGQKYKAYLKYTQREE